VIARAARRIDVAGGSGILRLVEDRSDLVECLLLVDLGATKTEEAALAMGASNRSAPRLGTESVRAAMGTS
jgi:hypothetical protein